jgi:peptidyl-tRNA hydrolase, PTH1 family
MHLLLGLGNPGRRYAGTRHNAGFMVLDRIAQRCGSSCSQKQFGALVARARLGDSAVVLAKPQSFMNLSGQPAASLRGFYKVDVADTIVVHDEVDLPFGAVRVKCGGGHGGHNGLKDLQHRLGSNDFIRVRVGVSRPPPGEETAEYVLSPFDGEEATALDAVLERAADAVGLIVEHGATAAMNRVNARVRKKKTTPGSAVDGEAPDNQESRDALHEV